MRTSFVATPGLETTELQEGAILFHAKSGKFVMLNRSAALVWAELASPKTEDELAQKLSASYADVAPATARQDVQDVLAKLRELELVSSTEA
jgi:PqqD family protein of HPr-rel-A system